MYRFTVRKISVPTFFFTLNKLDKLQVSTYWTPKIHDSCNVIQCKALLCIQSRYGSIASSCLCIQIACVQSPPPPPPSPHRLAYRLGYVNSFLLRKPKLTQFLCIQSLLCQQVVLIHLELLILRIKDKSIIPFNVSHRLDP